MDIRVPRLGEGVSSGTVVSILVSEGAQVKKDQTVLELETEKAVAPIPAPDGGTIGKILVKEGDSVAVGQPIMTLAGGGAAAAPAAPANAPLQPKPAAAPPPAQAQPRSEQTQAPAGPDDYVYQSKSGMPPPASPTVRKIAQQLGIDLNRVRGTEHGGRISMEDLKTYIARLQQLASQPRAGAPAAGALARPAAESIDFSKWGPVSKKKISNLRKTIGQKMAESWTTIPHVTQFEEADITALMALRKKYAPAYEKKGARLTLTSFIMKVVAAALKKYPLFNSSLDENTDEIVTKAYFHLGIAVDTEAGLIVPVIKDVDKKDMVKLSIELHEIAEKTRQRKISVDEIQGGTFNISNLGSIGGTFFTPIVNRPQVAVLGVGRGVTRPVVKKAEKGAKDSAPKIEPAIMLPLGLSYDHRVIDGADGARFIVEIVNGLENFNEKDVKVS